MWLGGCARPGPWTACSRRIDSGQARDDRGPGAAPRSAPRRFRGRGLRAEPAEHPRPWSRGSRRHRPAASALGRDHDQDHRLRGGPLRDQWCPGTGPARLTPRPVTPWARGGRGGLDSMIIGPCAGGMTAREIRHHTGGSTIGAGPGAGGRSRRSPTRCAGAVPEVAAPASGWPSTRRVHRGRDPRRWSAPTTGCRGRPNLDRPGFCGGLVMPWRVPRRWWWCGCDGSGVRRRRVRGRRGWRGGVGCGCTSSPTGRWRSRGSSRSFQGPSRQTSSRL